MVKMTIGHEPALRPEIGVLEVSRLQLVGLVHDVVDPGHQHVPHALQLTVVAHNLQVVGGLGLGACGIGIRRTVIEYIGSHDHRQPYFMYTI